MYKNDPIWGLNNAIMTEMFGHSNLGVEVVGTEKSIASVNKSNLTYKKGIINFKT